MDREKLIQKLSQGLEHFDSYQVNLTDDCPIFAEESNTLFEFAYAAGRLTVGDLRDLLTLIKEA